MFSARGVRYSSAVDLLRQFIVCTYPFESYVVYKYNSIGNVHYNWVEIHNFIYNLCRIKIVYSCIVLI